MSAWLLLLQQLRLLLLRRLRQQRQLLQRLRRIQIGWFWLHHDERAS